MTNDELNDEIRQMSSLTYETYQRELQMSRARWNATPQIAAVLVGLDGFEKWIVVSNPPPRQVLWRSLIPVEGQMGDSGPCPVTHRVFNLVECGQIPVRYHERNPPPRVAPVALGPRARLLDLGDSNP